MSNHRYLLESDEDSVITVICHEVTIRKQYISTIDGLEVRSEVNKFVRTIDPVDVADASAYFGSQEAFFPVVRDETESLEDDESPGWDPLLWCK